MRSNTIASIPACRMADAAVRPPTPPPITATRIREVRTLHDATILLCTHDMVEAETLADRVGLLDRGELLFLEPVDDVKERFGQGPGRKKSSGEYSRDLPTTMITGHFGALKD